LFAPSLRAGDQTLLFAHAHDASDTTVSEISLRAQLVLHLRKGAARRPLHDIHQSKVPSRPMARLRGTSTSCSDCNGASRGFYRVFGQIAGVPHDLSWPQVALRPRPYRGHPAPLAAAGPELPWQQSAHHVLPWRELASYDEAPGELTCANSHQLRSQGRTGSTARSAGLRRLPRLSTRWSASQLHGHPLLAAMHLAHHQPALSPGRNPPSAQVFGTEPQLFLPQIAILVTAYPGREIGEPAHTASGCSMTHASRGPLRAWLRRR
jgi:hypothetical protein